MEWGVHRLAYVPLERATPAMVEWEESNLK